uniref:CAAX prenyl protease 2/Lysostaphin resistance protein A-like domain-containing protein n=1 Tax=Dunaliella tertiolecta TaxID=3047 RepID=A0A7S3VL55_DUNTE|mmetsp:Transcript_24861/g.67697  ORF Transcript_24861/g.67697 Transcript_24861/m.67697 type:complete len:326 (+) Transcript_24861:39-1016(+)|eukprot:CAMPEP_0202354794 /NCGR_PEP_ID=MMETSP1126-20121109/9958_1 /ASSEMBLY_ACC=CAM_ASM_000457 /TAXON_ID=3047 /ORGANISM="Dunaliella tertiolecta, Strain CCMP1320" /LENGTH=325 /DNA_ID=CAMNT_0048947305 /DNA_START=20 /DNA_END=997 /DNA_ORIENTATION=+
MCLSLRSRATSSRCPCQAKSTIVVSSWSPLTRHQRYQPRKFDQVVSCALLRQRQALDLRGACSHQSKTALQAGSGQTEPRPFPSFEDGINWYCYTVLGLLFLTDFTPLGSSISSGGLLLLGAVQWVFFLLPTAYWMSQGNWPVKRLLLGENPVPNSRWLLIGGLLGVGLFVFVRTAIAIKSGVPLSEAWFSWNGQEGSSPLGLPLQKDVADAPQAVELWLGTAVSPAVCEELLYRGFLLAALQQPLRQPSQSDRMEPILSRTDAVLVAGVLFAATHLELSQFWGLSLLGFGAGGVAVLSGSTLPAILCHLAYNSSAVALVLLAQR